MTIRNHEYIYIRLRQAHTRTMLLVPKHNVSLPTALLALRYCCIYYYYLFPAAIVNIKVPLGCSHHDHPHIAMVHVVG